MALTIEKAERIAQEYAKTGFLNKSKALINAGYKESYANCGRREVVYKNVQVIAEIGKIRQNIAVKEENSREFVTKEYLTQYNKRKDNKTAHAYLRDLAKNCGWFALDNAQKVEQVKLDKAEAVEVDRIANILNLEVARRERRDKGSVIKEL